MAHVKAGGTAKNLHDSKPKYLGTKLFDGEKAKVGSILIRQRGTRILPGRNVAIGKDHTLFSLKEGVVKFRTVRKSNFNGHVSLKKEVSVL